jgi:hypothetical protein
MSVIHSHSSGRRKGALHLRTCKSCEKAVPTRYLIRPNISCPVRIAIGRRITRFPLTSCRTPPQRHATAPDAHSGAAHAHVFADESRMTGWPGQAPACPCFKTAGPGGAGRTRVPIPAWRLHQHATSKPPSPIRRIRAARATRFGCPSPGWRAARGSVHTATPCRSGSFPARSTPPAIR